jgi:hypothetical protein
VGRPGTYRTALLYREVYNRMVNVHHLNNLVWVWNQNGPAPGGEFYSIFPGKNYCVWSTMTTTARWTTAIITKSRP